jgi:hypothetical protein
VIVPVFALDSNERWLPVAVEAILDVGATVAGQPVDLNALPVRGGRIDFPADMRQPDAAPAVYHRIARGGGLHWHQFWMFWLYNPKRYAGFGEHEGDWEMCQLGCVDDAGERPVLMTCSQHSGGEKREYWRVQLEEGARGRPVVYVAVDSHALYFGAHHDVTDDADGADLLDVELRAFGPWVDWPGQWGNSKNSPGPLSTRRAWQAPHAYHGQARG